MLRLTYNTTFSSLAAAAGWCLCAWWCCESAAAQTPNDDDREPVVLTIPDCLGVSGAEVRSLVVLELGQASDVNADTTPTPTANTTRAFLECLPSGARISVQDPEHAAALSVELDLTHTATEARPRLLALTMTELIATSRLERSAKPPLTAAAAAPASPPPPPPPAGEAFAPWRLWLGVGAARVAQPAMFAPGVTLGVAHARDWFALAADVRLERGSASVHDAQLTLTLLSLGIGPAWRIASDHWELLLGASLRTGYAALEAEPHISSVKGRTLSGLWLGPAANAAWQLSLSSRWAIRLGLELGYVARPVRGRDASAEPLLEQDGLWLAAHAGLCLALR